MSLSIRDIAGTAIGATDEIFSGIVGIGSGVFSGTVRVYNNFDADDDVVHVKKVKLFIAPQSGSQAITQNFADPYRNIRSFPLVKESMSGVCTLASENGGSNPSGTMLSMYSGITGTGYDVIYSSGSNNFNQYDIYFTIPSGTVFDTASGAIFLGITYETFFADNVSIP